MKKRFISLLLVLVMVFSLLPGSALAAEGEPVEILEEVEEVPAEESEISPEPEEELEVASESEVEPSLATESAGKQEDESELVSDLDTNTVPAQENRSGDENSGNCGDDLFWEYTDDGTLNITGSGMMWSFSSSYNVPWDEIRDNIRSVKIGEGVTSIGEWAFYNCDLLTNVTIPDSLTSIGKYAFCYCTSLQSILIPTSVTYIAGLAFQSCSALERVTILSGISAIGDGTFAYCTSLSSITFPSSLNRIGNFAFQYCEMLAGVELPESLTYIGNKAFDGCTGLTSLTIPTGVTSIGESAFSGCTSLTSLVLPAGITSVNDSLFAGCTGLTDLMIPAGVTSIGDSAFSGCTDLTSLTIPGSVTSIGDSAFSGCTDLTSLTIPGSVTSIGDSAFSGCTDLTSLTIPGSVTSIGYDAFKNCSGLQTAGPVGGNYNIKLGWTESIPSRAFYGDKVLTSVVVPVGIVDVGEEAFWYCTGLQSVTLPTGLQIIEEDAFGNCNSLTGVTLPLGLISLGAYAFGSCSALKSITIPEGVTSIGESAFSGCDSLQSAGLPSTLTNIGEYAFSGTALTSISVPSAVTNIGCGAFSGCSSLKSVSLPSNLTRIEDSVFNYCEALKDITLPSNLKSIGSSAFYHCVGLTAVTIPSKVEDIESEAFSWCTGLTSITVPSSVTTIEDSAFYCCYGLASVTLPSGVTSIGDRAFGSCTALTGITLPSSLTSIGEGAFSDCSALTDITIPANVTSIGDEAFYGCLSLERIDVKSGNTSYSQKDGVLFNKNKTVLITCPGGLSGIYTIPDGVTRIENHAFDFCTNLTTVRFPSSVTSIGEYAFSWCTSLTRAEIPSGVTSIGENAFANSAIESMTIPSGVRSIADRAFSSCGQLASVTIPSGVTSIGEDAFSFCSYLQKIEIPASVTLIESGAFYYCISLTKIAFLHEAGDPLQINGYGTFKAPSNKKTSVYVPNAGNINSSIQNYDWANDNRLVTYHQGDGSAGVPLDVAGVLDEGDGWKLNWKCYGTIIDEDEEFDPADYEGFEASVTLEITLTGRADEIDTIIINDDPWLDFEYGINRDDIKEIIITGTIQNLLYIAPEVFKNYLGVEKVTLNCVYGIGAGAFQGCSMLERIYGLDEHLFGIGVRAFKDCVSLRQIIYLLSSYPTTLESIGAEAFMNTRLESIYLMDGITSIGKNAFKGCEDILTIYCYPNSGVQFYAEDNGINYELIKEYTGFRMRHDSWSFENYAGEFYFTDSDWKRLEMIAGDDVRKSVIQYWRNHSSNGSCHGMSAAAVLVKMGLLTPSDFSSGADELHDVSLSSSVKSLISYHHFAQFLDNAIIDKRAFKKLSVQQQLLRIESLAEAAMNGGAPFLLAVGGWYNEGQSGGHSVVAYGVEHYYDSINVPNRPGWYVHGKFYDSRILIYDVNYPKNSLINWSSSDFAPYLSIKDTALYYNHNSSDWYWPENPSYNALLSATNDPFVLAPSEAIDKLDYDILITNAAMGSTYQLTIDGQSYTVTPSINDGDVIAIPVCDGVGSSDMIVTIPNDATEYAITPSDNDCFFMIVEQDALVTVDCAGASSIEFHPDGSFTAVDVSGDYDLSVLYNEGAYTTPWNETHIRGIGSESDSISMEQTGDGMVIDGADGSVTVSVIDTAGNEDQLLFQGNSDAVLVTTMLIGGEEVPAIWADENGDGDYEKLVAVSTSALQITLDKEYMILRSGESVTLECRVIPVELTPFVTWSWEPAEENIDTAILSVSETGKVTALAGGAAYVIATLEINDTTYTARCRVDVVEGEPGEEHPIAEDVTAEANGVKGVRLTSPKAATELFKTDYTRIQVIPELTENNKMAQSVVLPTPEPKADAGIAIEGARFTVQSVADLFRLRVVDDRTLEVIPTQEALDNSASVKGRYISSIAVTVDGTEFTTGDLTLTVKKTEPKITAKAVSLNSYFADSRAVTFSGGTVVSAVTDPSKPLPEWLTYDEESQSFTYTGAQSASKSAKISMLVIPEGWCVQHRVTVTVSAKKTAPKLTLKPVSVTLKPGTVDRVSVFGTVTPIIFAEEAVTVSRIMEGKTEYENNTVLNVNLNAGGISVTAPYVDGKAHTYKVYLSVAGVEAAFTVKTLADSKAVGLTLKAVGTIDLAVANSPVTVTATTTNFHASEASYTVVSICKAKTEEDLKDLFDMSWNGNILTLRANGEPDPGTYTVLVTAHCGGETQPTKSVNFTVKRSAKVPAASLTLKATGSLDVLRPNSRVTLMPTAKNFYTFEPKSEDVTVTRIYNGADKLKVNQDVTDQFMISVENGTYLVGIKPDAEISHLDKFNITASSGGVSSKAVSLKLIQGKAAVSQNVKAVELLKTDRYSQGVIVLTLSDETLQGIDKVQLDSKSEALFSLKELGNGKYAIAYAGNVITTAKSQTVKLIVFLKGNQTNTPNATLSVKVNIV